MDGAACIQPAQAGSQLAPWGNTRDPCLDGQLRSLDLLRAELAVQCSAQVQPRYSIMATSDHARDATLLQNCGPFRKLFRSSRLQGG